MTVKELIKLLSEMDPHRIVILSADEEGSIFSPLIGTWQGAYRPESEWRGNAGFERLTKEYEDAGFSDEDVIVGGDPCVVLVPAN